MSKRTLSLLALVSAAAVVTASALPPVAVVVPMPAVKPQADAAKKKDAKDVAKAETPAAAAPALAAPALTKEQCDFFEAKIRPIFSANCYQCHSIEAGKAKGKLTLDTREGWQKGGDGGQVIVPGNPDASRLITAVHYNDADLQMPPKGEKLSDAQIADLTAWVKMGAPDPRTAPAGATKLTGMTDKARAHWAYQPVKEPPVPDVAAASSPATQPAPPAPSAGPNAVLAGSAAKAWVKTPVDAFVLAKLQQNGMRPSAPAPREALIRRATYDLIGLPPTPEEVAAFVKDRSPDAFAKVVDRLLASPHYGERWGRFWLDSARYSDTTGIEGNNQRMEYRYAYAWTYRDYVVNAFNADKPYDQFLKEQIAADLLPDAEEHPDSLAALGFLTVGKRFANPNDVIDERIDALSKSTMGLTVACARCHDHKFDPVPTADYYSLHGIFASTIEPEDKPLVGPKPSGVEYAEFQKELAKLEAKDRDLYFNYVGEKSSEFRKQAAAYVMVALQGRKNAVSNLKDREKLIRENNLDRDLYLGGGFKVTAREQPIFAPLVRFSQIPEEQFAERAKAVLAEVTSGSIMVPKFVGEAPARYTKAKGQGRDLGQIAGRRGLNHYVIEAFKQVTPESLHSLADVAAVYGKLFAGIDAQATAYLKASRNATDSKVSASDLAAQAGGADDDLVELFNIPCEIKPSYTLDTEHLKAVASRLPQQNSKAYQMLLFNQINELELTHPGSPGRAMVVEDAPVPHNSPIFIRGEALNRGPIVPRQFLEILSGPGRKPFQQGSGRLELAEDIASKGNPLTARVMVNRVWMHHFGEGFVRTPDDLGVQSEPPSQPELLDYLASHFMADGWSMKKLHRLIMLSSAYQQSSDTNPVYSQKDPDNRLLWRANLRRLDFEAIRDSMLTFTGKLDPTLGGKPVNLTDEPYSNRRSIYGYIDRGNVPELMQQFDFSDPDMTNSRRTSTIVPQQALFFMNSPMSADVARKVTTRPEFVNATDDAGRVKALYEVLFQRPPRPEEVRLAAAFIVAGRNEVAPGNAAAARKLEEQQARQAASAKPIVAGKKNGGNARAAIRNEGEIVARRPLNLWERYAQALLFTNEIAYVN